MLPIGKQKLHGNMKLLISCCYSDVTINPPSQAEIPVTCCIKVWKNKILKKGKKTEGKNH